MSPPTIWIRLPLEGRPELLLENCGEGDQERLLLWLRGNGRLLRIVGEAIAVENEALAEAEL